MKNVANAPIMPATTTSIAMMPMLVAIASGESLLPKQTGTGERRARRGEQAQSEEGFSHIVSLG